MFKFLATLCLMTCVTMFGGVGTASAACDNTVENCGTLVPDVKYGGGGKAVKTVKATACFTAQTSYDITLKNGRFEMVGAFVYSDQRSHERIKAVRGRVNSRGDIVCWSHNVVPGTYMAVWVTCRTPEGEPYEGWVAVKVTKPGRYQMTLRPDWNWRPSWLR